MRLSNTQIELLNLFSTNISESDLKELRKLLVDFYSKKSINLANEIWNDKKLSSADMEAWLNDPKQ